MPSIFHHLKVPAKKPTALVKVRDVTRWLAEVAKTEIVLRGKKQSIGASGAFGQMADGLITEGDPWEISRGDQGWIIGRGTIAGFYSESRVPRLNGVAIGPTDENDPPSDNPPQLAYRPTDGVIAIDARFTVEHDESIAATPEDESAALPFRVYFDTWDAWPAIKWADEISPTATLTVPNSDTESSFVVAVPIARITAGEAFPLRSTNVFMHITMNSIVAVR